MRPTPEIVTERLVLRLPAAGDVAGIVRYFTENREHLAASRPRMPEAFYTAAFWSAQIPAARAEYEQDVSLRLFAFDRHEPRRVVGNVNFTNIVRGPAQYCTLGYGLDRACVGSGYMTEALRGAIAFVHRDLNVHRVMANYVPHNRRSAAVLRRLGFTVEGYARDYLLLNGRWEDHILTSLLNPDWVESPTPVP
ncbi:MAG TPA: GNAT family N-acetyltransferase [Longimicrobiaceae bacterium]|nr:GNAT family N-acetyltransferase [Longimicrobiaceae bacterium]